MAQQYTTYGITPAIDLIKQNVYPRDDQQSWKRSFDVVASRSSHPVQEANASDNPPVPASFKRPCLKSHESNRIEASEIYSTTNRSTQAPVVSEYTQRQAAASTPTPTLNPLLRLSHPRYDLPEALVKNFASVGINSIYPWQSSCLLGRGILAGEQNLVYSAPTGGGKSLIADVLMLKRVIEDPTRKAILVLPYVALVQEKLQWLRKVVDGVPKNVSSELASQANSTGSRRQKPQYYESIRVVGYFGGSKAFRGTNWRDTDIAVCTFEKVVPPMLK